MAVRTPLKLDGSNNLIEMSATDIENIKLEMIRQYGAAPSVTLGVVSSGGTFAALSDTRLQAGAAVSDPDAFPTEATTGEPSVVTVNYDRIAYTTSALSAPADTSNKAFPVYQSGGNIYAMSLVDMRDTFVDDVIDRLTTDAATTAQAGTYFVSASDAVAGMTLVSATPIFNDTRANTAAYTAGGIPEARDQPTTITSYYLHRIDEAAAGTLPTPLQITAANHLQQYTTANWRAVLADVVQYYATQTGYKIVYAQGTSATNARGTGIVNTQLTGGAGNFTTFNDTAANLYYAQEFPNGTVTTMSTNYITCSRG